MALTAKTLLLPRAFFDQKIFMFFIRSNCSCPEDVISKKIVCLFKSKLHPINCLKRGHY